MFLQGALLPSILFKENQENFLCSFQWWLGGQAGCSGGYREERPGRNVYQTILTAHQELWRVLPGSEAEHEQQEPVVPWVLAGEVRVLHRGGGQGPQVHQAMFRSVFFPSDVQSFWFFSLPRGVLDSVNFGPFAPSKCQRFHCNAMRKAIKQNEHTPERLPIMLSLSRLEST